MENSDKEFGELPSTLKGNSSILLSETGNAPAKIIKEFRKKSDKPVLKGAYIEEAIYVGDDQLENLVNIKSKKNLLEILLDCYNRLLRMLFQHYSQVDKRFQVLLKPYQKDKISAQINYYITI